MFSKQAFLDACEMFDSARIIPRVVLVWFFWMVTVVIFKVLNWYLHMTAADEKTIGDGAVVIGVISAVTGMSGVVLKIYVSGGRDWDGQQPYASTTTVRTSTISDPPPVRPTDTPKE
jgi:hypothetical protein